MKRTVKRRKRRRKLTILMKSLSLPLRLFLCTQVVMTLDFLSCLPLSLEHTSQTLPGGISALSGGIVVTVVSLRVLSNLELLKSNAN